MEPPEPRTADIPNKRERSARYPGATLQESLELCRAIEERGLDGLPAEQIALGQGYKNLRTRTFSAPLSAARQFGLLALRGDGYGLTDLARSLLHPVDPAELPRLYRRALLEPPLYADLAARLAGKRVPEAAVLANLLYHGHQIKANAKQAAAETFLASARFAGALGDDQVFRPEGEAPPGSPSESSGSPRPTSPPRARPAAVRIDLRLWGADEGKVIRLRAPESITPASLERLIQALRLHVRIVDEPSE